MIKLALAGALLVFAAPAFAAFEDLGAGARGPGMGNAFVPIADDVYTIHYNAAGLGTLERPQLGTSYSSLYPGIRDGAALSASWLGYVHPLKEGRRGTLGASWSSFALSGSLYREDALSIGYGKRAGSFLGGELYLGAVGKYLRTSLGSVAEASNAVPNFSPTGTGQADPLLSGRRSRGTFSGDVGLLQGYGRHYVVGLTLTNVNQPDVSLSGTGASKLPMGAKLGLAYRSLISNLAAQVDTQEGPTGKRDIWYTAAAERWFAKLFTGDFGARGGLTLGSREVKQLSLGLSYRSRRFRADYAMALPIGGVSTTFGSHRVGLNFRFGRPSEEEESLELVLDAMKRLKSGQTVAAPSAQKGKGGATAATLSEYLAQARGSEARARYADALEKMRSALMIAPADRDVLTHFQKLSFVASMIKDLPDFKSDPSQASLHLGILAYIAGNDLEAVKKVSEALAHRPDHRALDAFLTQLEMATGVKRTMFATAQRPDTKTAVNLTRANAALEEGDYDKAIELSLAVLQFEPENAAAWQILGTAYFAGKDFEASLKAWRKAYEHEKSPAIRTAIKGYIKSIERAQQNRRSVSAPKQPVALPQAPEKPRMSQQQAQELFNRAIDHYTRREFREAKELLERIVESNPDHVEAQKALRRVKDELQ